MARRAQNRGFYRLLPAPSKLSVADGILVRDFTLDPQSSDRRKRPGVDIAQVAGALELPFVLVGMVLVGGGIGYLLDKSFHSSPVITIIGGFIGFVAGIWEILRKLSRERRREG